MDTVSWRLQSLWTRDLGDSNGKADLSLKEAARGEGGQSVTEAEAGPGLSGSKTALAVTRPPRGTVREDAGSPKPKLPTFLRHGALPEDATTFQYLHTRPSNKQGLWRP